MLFKKLLPTMKKAARFSDDFPLWAEELSLAMDYFEALDTDKKPVVKSKLLYIAGLLDEVAVGMDAKGYELQAEEVGDAAATIKAFANTLK